MQASRPQEPCGDPLKLNVRQCKSRFVKRGRGGNFVTSRSSEEQCVFDQNFVSFFNFDHFFWYKIPSCFTNLANLRFYIIVPARKLNTIAFESGQSLQNSCIGKRSTYLPHLSFSKRHKHKHIDNLIVIWGGGKIYKQGNLTSVSV